MSLRLDTLGVLVDSGDGWALFGRTLLVLAGWGGPLPVESDRYEAHHYVSARSWTHVAQRCAEEVRPRKREGWLTPGQIATLLGVTDRTVRAWAQDGRFHVPGYGNPAGLLVPAMEGPAHGGAADAGPRVRGRDVRPPEPEGAGGAAVPGIGGRIVLKKRR
jgi:hypothetical protein